MSLLIYNYPLACSNDKSNYKGYPAYPIIDNNDDTKYKGIVLQIFVILYVYVSHSFRSYGILLYEFVTAGSVPYANFSNNQVKAKVHSHANNTPFVCITKNPPRPIDFISLSFCSDK